MKFSVHATVRNRQIDFADACDLAIKLGRSLGMDVAFDPDVAADIAVGDELVLEVLALNNPLLDALIERDEKVLSVLAAEVIDQVNDLGADLVVLFEDQHLQHKVDLVFTDGMRSETLVVRP